MLDYRCIGIDGEGYTLKSGKHRYTYMAACTSDELVSELYDAKGLKTKDILNWILALPGKPYRLVGFSLGYDRTKWLEDYPNDTVYLLHHPEERPGDWGPKDLRHGGFVLNMQSSKFVVDRVRKKGEKKGRGSRRVVWDLFRFYQSSFVKACRAWKIGTAEEIERIERMKAKRGNFRLISTAEKEYCQDECKLLAQLAEKLLEAHEEEGLALSKMFGPGSTAELVLKKCKADEIRSGKDDEEWVQKAYFGGRFEASHVGPVKGPLYAYDIASAYPYALALLPCLHPEHGRWVHKRITAQVLQEDVACIRYRLGPGGNQAWGPLPLRLPDGNIVFPLESSGGWAWSVELRAAIKLHPGVEPIEAWVWQRKCVCPPPFRQEIKKLFLRRLELGKTTRGLVLKLGLNSMYGKSIQGVGSPRFRCVVRAGLVTARTRGMLLEAVMCAKDPWNVLELATDSVMSREPLKLPEPIHFGASGTDEKGKKKELGEWEEKNWPGGVFLLRPGLRFPIGQNCRDTGSVAARGLGVRVLQENRRKVLRAWHKIAMKSVYVQQPTMFHGARSSIRKVLGDVSPWGEQGYDYVRDASYGRWETPEPRILSYAPGPKRQSYVTMPSGEIRLGLWHLPGVESSPYERKDDEEDKVKRGEQPDGGELSECLWASDCKL